MALCINPLQAQHHNAIEDGFPPDWVPEPASVSLCQGHYQPFPESLSTNFEDNQLPIELSADVTRFTLSGDSLLQGNVTLRQGPRFLHTDEIIIEREPNLRDWKRIIARGHLHYVAPGISVWGDRAEYTRSPQHFLFENAIYRWYPRHARGRAQAVEIDENTNIHLHKANYTTCAPNMDTWILSANKISLYPKKGRATAEHIRLDMKGVPVFYFPYINYPIDNKRHSGFLFPSYGTSSTSGYEITLPYYWNMAPNYDFTFAGKWLSLRGLEAQSKFRYLFAQSGGVVQWHFLPDDRAYGTFQKENLLSPPGGLSFNDPRIIALEGNNNRSAFNLRHNTHWDRRWQLNVIFDYVSDDNYFVDLGNDLSISSTIHLPQQANLAYYGDYWTHVFNVEEYQVLQPIAKDINEEIYRRQPQWVFQGIYPNQILGFSFGLNGEMVNFNHRPDLLTQMPVTTGQRYHLRPSVSLPIQEQWYFLTPRVQGDWLQYNLKLSQADILQNFPENPGRFIPLYDIDSGLFFERKVDFTFLSGTQTLEPRLYYLYVPFHDQHNYPDFDSGIMNFSYAQLFRDNRFSGRDRIGDANQVSVSLMSRFLPNGSAQELLRASIGQIFYFRDRRVLLCDELGQENACFLFEDVNATSRHSKVIAQTELHASPTLTGALFLEWDRAIEQAAFTLQYQPNPQKVFNINYYWLKHDFAQNIFTTGETGSLNQIDASLLWPLSLHWELLSLWRYDFEKHQTVELLGGLEYSGCCLALQFIGSSYRLSNKFYYPKTYDTAVFVQVVFKGLSAIPWNNPDSRLKQKIPGYRPLSARQNWLTLPQKTSFPPEEIALY